MSLLLIEGFDWAPISAGIGSLLSGKWTAGAVDGVSGGVRSARALSTNNDSSGGSLTYTAPVANQHNIFIIGHYHVLGSSPSSTKTIVTLSTVNGTAVTVQWLSGGAVRVIGPSGTLGTTATGIWLASTAKFLEVKAFIHDSTGYVIVKLNGTIVLNLTAVDTKPGASDLVTTAGIIIHDGTGTSRSTIDDIHILNGAGSVLNDFVGDCAVPAFRPDGNGANSAWLGSDGNSIDNYLLVDESPISMTDYVAASSVGVIDTYAHANLATGTPIAVQVALLALRTDTVQVKEVAALARASGGAEAVGATRAIPVTTADTTIGIFETEPGGASWSLAKLNAAEFGMKLIT